MRLRGLHHVTAICRDLEATIAFYRDVMGLAIVRDGPSDDDPGSRHVWFGALDGEPGALVSFMEYPQLPKGVTGVGSTHHFALVCGVLLASLGGLDTAVREHFNGYKSHSSVLAGLPGVIAAAALFFARAPWIAVAVGAALVFGLAFWGFRTAFRRRSGGLSFR